MKLFIAILLFNLNVFAQSTDANSGYSEFYTVSERSQNISNHDQLNPLMVMTQVESDFQVFLRQAKTVLNLFSWEHHNAPLENPQQPYNRKEHFGGWIVDHQNNECYNTRARILIRDSVKPVQFSENNKCIVQSGEWHDPYTGLTFTLAHDIQIDHFIPLKNAYQTGAWRWNKKQRCLYANYRYNSINLVAVSGSENQSKSDSSPDGYMPPNKEFRCEYLQRWLRVKLAWRLAMTPPEAQAMKKFFVENNCDAKSFQLSAEALTAERQDMSSHSELCQE